jgi:8-oxo-dGTP pyrophosphatase MutT (NUDIX family)
VHSAAMRADVVDGRESRFAGDWSRSRTCQPPAKFFRLSQLRRLRGCEQVAAVCYRLRRGEIEFLLVRTNSGHWTFPKGSAEPGLTHAQAAALEAFEEAGVHGRIEEASFTRYIRRKRTGNSAAKSAKKKIAIQAHLCEVMRLEAPQEPNRDPTWFSAEKAKQRLSEDRTPDYAAELTRVVHRAVTRIQGLRSPDERHFKQAARLPRQVA